MRADELMKPGTAVTIVLCALVLVLGLYLHDSAHRYDVVVAGAGSGGSQETQGSTEVIGYLVDHKTGQVWELQGRAQMPMILVPCPDSTNVKPTNHGCEVQPPPKKP